VKYVIRPSAKDDITRQFRYYLLHDAVDAAARFLDAVDESIEALRRMPNLGAPKPLKNPLLAGLRAWPVKGFEDLSIYYLVQEDVLRVVQVLHGRRDIERLLGQEKGYWETCALRSLPPKSDLATFKLAHILTLLTLILVGSCRRWRRDTKAGHAGAP